MIGGLCGKCARCGAGSDNILAAPAVILVGWSALCARCHAERPPQTKAEAGMLHRLDRPEVSAAVEAEVKRTGAGYSEAMEALFASGVLVFAEAPAAEIPLMKFCSSRPFKAR